MVQDKCVLCDKKSKVFVLTYIDGVGQLCQDCYKKVYIKSKTKRNNKPLPS